MKRTLVWTAAVAALVLASSCKSSETPQAAGAAPVHEFGAAAVNKDRLLKFEREPGSWLAIGGGYDEQHFSKLNQINDTNAGNLGLAWYADIDTERGQEATPIIVDGVMYVTSAWSMVKAYDIKTGKEIWNYDPAVDKAKGADACCDVVNRGVAAWNGKIYLGALDGRLIALNGKTGKVVWEQWTVPKGTHHTITGVPRIANGKVFIGNGGAEYDIRGNIAAFDAESGKQLWTFYTVPGDPSKPYEQPILKEAAKTWKGDQYWKLGGGATVWDGIVYDPKTNLVMFGTGNGLAWAQELRSPGGGDNWFVSSIVAVDADTGKYAWHYQETPGDEWDYDNCNPLMLADLKYPDGVKHVVMQASKNGFYYIMEAKTGKLISAAKYQPDTNWASHIDLKTGRPVESPLVRYSTKNISARLAPAALGMHNWHPMAMSPETGYIYIPTQYSAGAFAMKDNFVANPKGTNTGNDGAKGRTTVCNDTTAKCGNLDSYILAWDPVKEKEVWRIPNEVYGSSGILATSGNLIFSGNHKGEFAAYNATTGKKVWSTGVQARVVAAPSTYTVDGKQYVTVLVGARGLPANQTRTVAVSANNSRLLVFGAGGTAKLPTVMNKIEGGVKITLNPPLSTASNETIFEGEQLYKNNCAACHGAEVSPGAGSIAPDLRYSGLLPIRNGWDPIVRDGQMAARGMPSFGQRLSKDETDAVLAYVIKRANDEKAAQEAAAKKN